MAVDEHDLRLEGETEAEIALSAMKDNRDPVQRAADDDIAAGDDADAADATEWLLGALADPPEITNRLIVNVGGVGKKRIEVAWVIKSLPGKLIRKIREDAETVVRRSGNTGAGTTGAGFVANLRICVEGSLEPNIKEISRQQNIADPAIILERVLNHKQGLIDQIAGSILQLSGYDQEDVRDAVEVSAAGN